MSQDYEGRSWLIEAHPGTIATRPPQPTQSGSALRVCASALEADAHLEFFAEAQNIRTAEPVLEPREEDGDLALG